MLHLPYHPPILGYRNRKAQLLHKSLVKNRFPQHWGLIELQAMQQLSHGKLDMRLRSPLRIHDHLVRFLR